MRSNPLRVTAVAWFGPKRLVGWGWSPRSGQGWASSALFVVGIVGIGLGVQQPVKTIAIVAIIVAFLVLIVFTGDPPGGPADE